MFRPSGISSRRLGARPGFGRGVERPAGPRGEVETVGEAEAQPLDPGPGDHRGIVGAELDRRGARSVRPPACATSASARGAPCWRRRRRPRPEPSRRQALAIVDAMAPCGRRGSRSTAAWKLAARSALDVALRLGQPVPQRRLEAREGEIAVRPAQHRARAAECAWDRPLRPARSTAGPPG